MHTQSRYELLMLMSTVVALGLVHSDFHQQLECGEIQRLESCLSKGMEKQQKRQEASETQRVSHYILVVNCSYICSSIGNKNR